ncbi:MAG: glycosyltransferase [bacterium]
MCMTYNNLKFSIVIPAHNEEKFLFDCLQSIKDQQAGFDYEIIVVDNGSDDDTAGIAKNFGVKLVSDPIVGVGRARRSGTVQARGEYILHLDADTRLPVDYLVKVLDQFESDQHLACLGGQVFFYDAPWWQRLLRYPLFFILTGFSYFISVRKVGVVGNNMAFKKELYDKTSGFDPDLKFAEDADLCRKLSRFGKIKIDSSLHCRVSARRFKPNFNLLVLSYNYVKMCLNRKCNYDFPKSQDL